MKTENMFECEICFYRGQVEDFTPVTSSANLAALECPKCLNNDEDTFREIDVAMKEAA